LHVHNYKGELSIKLKCDDDIVKSSISGGYQYSGPCPRNGVRVQLPPSAPNSFTGLQRHSGGFIFVLNHTAADSSSILAITLVFVLAVRIPPLHQTRQKHNHARAMKLAKLAWFVNHARVCACRKSHKLIIRMHLVDLSELEAL